MHLKDSRVTVYFWLPLVTCIHMSYVKILLSVLVGRVRNDYTEERKKNPEKYTLWRFRTRRRPRSKHPLQIFVTVFCLTELVPQLNVLEPEILIKLNSKKSSYRKEGKPCLFPKDQPNIAVWYREITIVYSENLMKYIIWGNRPQSCNVGVDVTYNFMEFRDVVNLGVLMEFIDILVLGNVMELCYTA
jgi:hypothetical protein